MPVEIDDPKVDDVVEGGSDEAKKDDAILYPDKDTDADDDKDADGEKDKDVDKDAEADKDKDTDKDEGKDKDADKDKDKDADVDTDKDAGVTEEVKAEDLKFPEGVKVDEGVQEKFLTLINNKDMSVGEKAQAFVDLQQEVYAAAAESHQDQIDTWEKEVSLDKRFVGDTGDKLDENRALAKKAMDMVDIKGLPELMSREQTGLGSNPIIFDLFVKIGKVISADSFKSGGVGGSKDPKSDSEVLYGAPVNK